MPRAERFDHVGITVQDLQAASAFFRTLGFEQEGPAQVIEGDFLDTVIGIAGARTEVAMLQLPSVGTRLELSMFHHPLEEQRPRAALATELGLRNICFEVDDLRAVVERVRADGFELVGGIGEYENTYLMCYVRGPEGITVSLAESIGDGAAG